MKPADDRRSFVDIISTMKELRETMSPAEGRVADAVLDDVEFAVHASNAELAQRADVSEPTVTRFCRAIGCEGVRDFKVKLAQSLVVGTHYFGQPPHLSDNGSGLTYWGSVFYHAREAIHRVEQQLDPAKIRTAVEMLAAAKQVMVFGIGGGSTAIAQDAQYRLFRYGIAVTAYSDPQLMRMVASSMGPDDVVLALSATGRSPEIIDSVRIARQYHARVISITAANSDLAEQSDMVIGVSVPEFPDIMKPTASRYAYLIVVDLLATGVAYRLGESAQETLRRIRYNLLTYRDGDALEPLGD